MVRASLVASLLMLVAGCSGPLGAARRDFDRGRYPQALGELRALETEARDWEGVDAARYALYRGLTELALGDATRAHAWLLRARNLAAADESLLTPAEIGRLGAAWAALGLMPGRDG